MIIIPICISLGYIGYLLLQAYIAKLISKSPKDKAFYLSLISTKIKIPKYNPR